MKKHMHAYGHQKRAIQAENKEQRRRRKANQREGLRLRICWMTQRFRKTSEYYV